MSRISCGGEQGLLIQCTWQIFAVFLNSSSFDDSRFGLHTDNLRRKEEEMVVALRLRSVNTSSSSSCLSSSSRHVPAASRNRSSKVAASCRLPSLSLVCALKRNGVAARAADKGASGQVKTEDEMRDNRIGDYCSLEEKAGRRTLGDLEADFMAALQSFYYEGKPIMSNEEFDNLKEDLMWEGSRVVLLSSDEHKFMEASLAYQKGKPILGDEDYDRLKSKLKKAGSAVAIQGPRCIIRSKRVVSDASVDYLKMTLLNAPAAIIALGLVFFLDDLTGFKITYLLELPEPYSFFFTWFIVLPITFLIAQSLTNIAFKNILILKGPCPDCGTPTTSFFGTILTVDSGGPVNNLKCEQCGTKLIYNLEKRLIEVDLTPDPPKKGKGGAKSPAATKSAS